MNDRKDIADDVKIECVSKIVSLCHAHLFTPNGEQVLSYLKNERGLTEETIRKFKLGCFPKYADVIANRAGSYTAWKCGIISFKEDGRIISKFLTNNVIIPIFNTYGEPEAIMGRSMLDSEELKALGIPKYINSFYRKTSNLFGLNFARDEARKKKEIIIVEGNFDVITAHQYGIENIAATSKAMLHKTQYVLASRYADTIKLSFDNDEAGRTGTSKAIDEFKKYKETVIVDEAVPSKYKDIDEYLRKNYDEERKRV